MFEFQCILSLLLLVSLPGLANTFCCFRVPQSNTFFNMINNDKFLDAEAASNNSTHLFIMILCGIPGSGKSTFSDMLLNANPTKFVRISQDVLGKRKKCENACKKALRDNKIPIIDRCNFNSDQRQYFLSIASEYNVPVDCIVFQYDKDECIIRCVDRTNHETINPGNAKGIVSLMAKQFHPPTMTDGDNNQENECYRTLHFVTSFEQAEMTASAYVT